ncbi:c-type cytochrome [Pelagibacterium lacus]|uniref:Cytochrome c n=1 Tax=Pelagibacterium lacus TaxID=2282655 RepID=A0A369W5G3_9HYPH|nr:c-type cytochrome [Pelagibacterium lacus]RDE09914.1 cytochrome c [Pelagibacterium lacus]
MIKTLFIAAFMMAAVPAFAQDTPAADEAALSAEAMALAKTNYDDFCAACHAANGSGDIGPSLRGNGKLADAAFVYRQIAQGGSEMPGFVDVLSTDELLALATYVRTNFGNDYGPVTEEDAGLAE